MRLRAIFSVLAVAMVSVTPPALPDPLRMARAECPADPALARLMADSELVVIGKLTVPRDALDRTKTEPFAEFVEMQIRVESLVKGKYLPFVTLKYYNDDNNYSPWREDLIAVDEVPAIFFLSSSDRWIDTFGFAGSSRAAVQPATQQAVAAARTEALRQFRIDRGWRIDSKAPHFAEVKELIAKLGVVEDDDQQEVFDRLERLGEAAVPAIVALMDDRRPLKTYSIVLENHAEDSFEKFRHYGPREVVDGLAAVLNQITHSHYGFIYNGATPNERDAAVAGWRVHASDLPCSDQRSR